MRTRFGPLLWAGLMAVSLPFLLTSHAHAESTGLASIHPLTQVGNKLCMLGHYHFGDDGSRRSKAHALAAAKRSWANFVVLEYGSDWGRFALSARQGGKCTGNKASGFQCSVSSNPCRLLRGGLIKAKARRGKKRRHAKARRKHRSVRRLSPRR